MNTAELNLPERLQRLEDLHELQQLRARYCQLLDDGHWRQMTELFTEDGVFAGLSTARGRSEMLEFFPTLNSTSVTAWWHFSANETLEIHPGEPDTASGTTWLWQPCVIDGTAHAAAGRYEDMMQRCEDGVWRFTERRVHFFFWGPLDQGWDAGLYNWPPAESAADPRTLERASRPWEKV